MKATIMPSFKSILKAAVFAALIFPIASCADMKTAKVAAKEGDYATALKNYEKLAEIGLPDAQLELAKLYRDGSGVAKDEKKALDLIQKSADGGNAKALTELGRLYADGKGVPVDGKKASALFEQAAQKGDTRAYYYRGQLFREGEIVGQDLDLAQSLYLKACIGGYEKARERLDSISMPKCPKTLVPVNKSLPVSDE